MSKQTVIDWQRDSLLMARGLSRGNKIQFEQVSYQHVGGAGDAPGEAGDTHSLTLEQAVQQGCAELGVKGDVTLIAPREMVEIKTIAVPKIDPDELPDVIRFQAQRQLVNMTDSWALDYIMLPQAPGQEMQTALVSAISPSNMAEMDRACTRAGLQVARIVFRPIEIARFALDSGSLPTTQAAIIVCVSESNADILILRDRRVIQVRGTRLPSEPELIAGALKGEIRRSLLAAAPQLVDTKLENALLISTNSVADALDGVVAEACAAPVAHLDPSSLLPDQLPDRQAIAAISAHRIAAMAGALELERADKRNVIDFKNPKKRAAKKKNTGRLLLYGGAAAALLLTGLGWWITTSRSLDQEIAYFRSQTAEKAPVVDWSKKKMEELNELQDFLDASPNWLDELSFIATKIPSSEKIIFESLNFSTQQRDRTALISVPLRVNESGSIAAFEESLADANHSLQASNAAEIPQANDGYKWRVDEAITIKGRGWDVFGAAPVRKDGPATAEETVNNEASAVDEEQAATVDDASPGNSPESPEQPSAEQPSAEQPSAEQPTAEQPTAEQPTSEQPTSEQPTSEQPTSEQPTFEQPAAEPVGAQPAEVPQVQPSPSDSGPIQTENQAQPIQAGTQVTPSPTPKN